MTVQALVFRRQPRAKKGTLQGTFFLFEPEKEMGGRQNKYGGLCYQSVYLAITAYSLSHATKKLYRGTGVQPAKDHDDAGEMRWSEEVCSRKGGRERDSKSRDCGNDAQGLLYERGEVKREKRHRHTHTRT